MNTYKWQRAFLSGLAITVAAFSAHAQTPYPNKPIRFILGFGPGSTTDILARTLADGFTQALGQPIVVENRPGALSTIATEAVVKAAPDGYTFGMAANSGVSTGPAGLVRNVRYDPLKDLQPVGNMIQAPYVLLVDPKIPANSVSELLAYMKANSKNASCASGNANGRVYCELIKRKSGISITTVPYKSTPDAALAVMGSQVSVVFLDLPSAVSRVRTSQLRPLALMYDKKSSALPDVPLANDVGLAGIPSNLGWVGLFAPTGVPAPIISRMNGILNSLLNRPDIRKNLEQGGFEVVPGTPEALGDFLRKDYDSWKRLIKELDLPPEG